MKYCGRCGASHLAALEQRGWFVCTHCDKVQHEDETADAPFSRWPKPPPRQRKTPPRWP